MPKTFHGSRMESKVSKSDFFLIEAKGWNENKSEIREGTKKNDFVGNGEKNYRIVGLGTIGLRIDLKFLYTVRDNPLRGVEKSGCFGHVSSGILKGIDDQFLFEVFHCFFKRE